MCQVPPIAKKARPLIKTLREQTLQVHGVKLFNRLPWELWNMRKCDIGDFKENLDQFYSWLQYQSNQMLDIKYQVHVIRRQESHLIHYLIGSPSCTRT